MNEGALTERPAIARLLRNDRSIMTAALRVLAERGWGALSIRAIAHEAGLADPTVKQRHREPLDVAIALWRNGLGAELVRRLATLLTAHGLITTPNAAAGDPASRAAAWRHLHEPNDALRAATELAIVALFEPALHEAVDHDLGAALRTWCTPTSRHKTAALTAARRALLLTCALGEALTERWAFIDQPTLATHHTDLATALTRTPPTTRLPEITLSPFLSQRLDDDPLHDALLRTLLHHVAERGFEGAIMNAVYDAAGVTKSFAFGRHPSKLAMFIDAAERHRQASVAANYDLQARLAARHDDVTTTAVFLRTGMQRTYALGRALALEQVRMTWHEPAVANSYLHPFHERARAITNQLTPIRARAHVHRLMLLSEGTNLLAAYAPDAWRLPLHQAIRPYLDVAIERATSEEP